MNEMKLRLFHAAQNGFGRRSWIRNVMATFGGTAATGLLSRVEAAQTGAAASPSATNTLTPTKAPAAQPMIVALASKCTVETTSGKVRGYTRNGIYTFKGMPYADTTAGKNRYLPPVKPVPWAGVRSSLALGPVCPQPYTSTLDSERAGWRRDEEAFMFEWNDGHPGEDCLRVNVWTPSINDNRKRPVMVWIHGGGFTSGSCDELRSYDGENLSRRGDLVVVSLNHRLGPLGYLNLMEYSEKWAASANVGMLDLVAALEWVRDNIGNFGGDSSRVMIFGQSGGGSKVGTLMAMPSAKRLFHRASIQSGSGLRGIEIAESARSAALLIKELGLSAATLDRIQELPNEQIVQAGQNAARKLLAASGGAAAGRGGGGMRWGPVVDGKILPRHPWEPDAPSLSAEVPLMVGTVLNEQNNSIQRGDASLDDMTMDEVRRRLKESHLEKANSIIEVFQEAHPKATPYELFSRVSAAGSRQNAITQAERKAAQGAAPAYLYWFTWQTPVLNGRPRAFHCAELSFCFYNTDRCAPMTGGGADARALAAKVSDAWIHFARNGDPNHAGLPKWPAFTKADCPTMIFDNVCAARNNPDKAERDALRA